MSTEAGELEVECPICGGVVESVDIEELVELASEHCQVAHRYSIPREHVLKAMRPADIAEQPHTRRAE